MVFNNLELVTASVLITQKNTVLFNSLSGNLDTFMPDYSLGITGRVSDAVFGQAISDREGYDDVYENFGIENASFLHFFVMKFLFFGLLYPALWALFGTL